MALIEPPVNTHFPAIDSGEFELRRYPARKSEKLLAWNSADKLLIEELSRQDLPTNSILAVNDDQGALCVALTPKAIWTDSALSSIAIHNNLELNGLSPIPIVPSTESPEEDYAAVALKIPKLLSYFEYQLAVLAKTLQPGTPVVTAGMDKHLSPAVASIMERYIGPTTRHPGRHKARCFTAIRNTSEPLEIPANASYYCDPLAGNLVCGANVFSRDKIDIGSRFLLDNLEQLKRLDPAEHAIDLACGNGILGLVAKAKGLCKNIAFCDESAMAVACAQHNAKTINRASEHRDFTFHQGDGLLDFSGPQANLVLCNPPFHSNHSVDDYVGRRLIEQSAQYLQPSGALCLVANSHLPYLSTLKKGFTHVEKLAQNKKFTIWLAQK